MKNTLNKLRIWLIHKLGGTHLPNVCEIKTTKLKAVPINSCIHIDRDTQLRFYDNPVGYKSRVRQELAYKLAETLFENESLYELAEREDYNTASKIYKATMLVFEKEGAKE